MRPIRLTYLPDEADLTRFASNVTGATWTLTNTTSSDELAHTVTIKNDSATDHSGKTALLTGTDQNGNVITETLSLPGSSATVTSTLYFKTLTSIVPSATIGADTMDIGQGAYFSSVTIPLDWRSGIVAFDVIVSSNLTYTVQYTSSDIQTNTNPNWLNSDDSAVVAATASASSNFVGVPVAMRVIATAAASGTSLEIDITQRNF